MTVNPFLDALAGDHPFRTAVSSPQRTSRHERRTILARLEALRALDSQLPLVQRARLEAIREARDAGVGNAIIAQVLGLSEGRVSVLARCGVGVA
ncbi:hypothetical protein [Mycolicibacterium fortuitum]|uniref:hypothetical protein n=1 Tax=Mycolicibacterium fortuitum TaxID=1766 RepID=UPI001CDC651A|nr:hypothetical protein [Mycolicibacterium fortuitum]UBV14995.1 hypothetical protein H8Z57_30655 [Mycolicibacterium fortuitum]